MSQFRIKAQTFALIAYQKLSRCWSQPSAVGNQRGQGLVEYLIIVALMGVATIGIIRVMGEAVSKRFATITENLQGNEVTYKARIDKSSYKKRNLGNFMEGSADKGKTDSAEGE